MCLFAYDAKFSKTNLSGQIYDIKCIFLAHIMLLVHIPFKPSFIKPSLVLRLRHFFEIPLLDAELNRVVSSARALQ